MLNSVVAAAAHSCGPPRALLLLRSHSCVHARNPPSFSRFESSSRSGSASGRSIANSSFQGRQLEERKVEKPFGSNMGEDGTSQTGDASQYQSILRQHPMGVGTWSWGDKKTWGFKGEESEKQAQEAFLKSIECGVYFFDTASVYGDGESEQMLGRFLKHVEPAKREKLVIATKYIPLPYHIDCRKQLLKSLKQSLSRLQLEKVDLYQIHGPALSIRSIEHLASGLADAYEAGLCKEVGVSNFSADQVRRAHATLLKRNIALQSNQVEFSLLRRLPELHGLLSTCSELGVLLLAYSPLAMGRLTGKYSVANPPPSNRRFGKFGMEEIEPLLQKMKEIADARGKTSSQVALNWIISKGAIPIPGAKNAKQAEDNAGALGWKLTSEEVDQLSQLGKEGKINRYWQNG